MKKLTPENLTEEVLGRLSGCFSPRKKEVLTSLIQHMHAFAREVQLTTVDLMAHENDAANSAEASLLGPFYRKGSQEKELGASIAAASTGDEYVLVRGRFRADAKGYFEFRTARPCYYPIPTDGPVGKLVLGSGSHPYRPAHVHFIVTAPGFERLVTALYIEGDQYLDTDVVFGSRGSLVAQYKKNERPGEPDVLEWDFVLAAAKVPRYAVPA